MKTFVSLFVMLSFFLSAKAVTKVICVGASITWGAFIEDHEHYSFPGQLQTLLGNDFSVKNLGVGGTTMLRKGNSPYWKTNEFQLALKSEPDIVFIDLGGNDAKLINRIYRDNIRQDCMDMIDTFRHLTSHPRVIVLLPIVSFVKDTTGIWDRAIIRDIIPGLRQAAYEKGAEVVDMHQLLVNHEELIPDKIHPNKTGSAIMAKRLYDMVIQKRDVDFDIFKKLPQPFSMSSFAGYQSADFTMNGRPCKVVKPKWSAEGHPWIWRARFWGHEPQTDIALLERGFHLVYCDASELFGNAEAISLWNKFYDMLHHCGLAKKAVMEGMSRGAVYVYNWAAENPHKVACTYVDNPLLDMKSWPGGLTKLPQTHPELEEFKADYHITTQEQLVQFNGSPIDKVKQIVKGNYPMLILCADEDEAALPEDNTLPFEQKVKALNGRLTVIHKPGFKHHPHSLPNPAPIVDFILKSTGYYVEVPK